MDQERNVRAILREMADRLHVPVSCDHLLQAHRSLTERSAHQMAVECRRAAALPGKEPPPKDWVAFLIMASRSLNDAKLNVDLLKFRQRLETHYGPFNQRDINPDGATNIPSLGELRARMTGNDNTHD